MSHGWNNCQDCGFHFHDAEGDVYGECPRCVKSLCPVKVQVKTKPDFEKLYYEGVNIIGHLNNEIYDLSVERTYLLNKIQEMESK